ncbi:TlpA family protein disulfide reductase [Olivibacter sp. SDN3]|uniref:TlpA family protein disulfide reductase n=1 Tax=Olivibacter sp. SDN3 TaxID=2764720 RepID=UPI001650FAA0|nr:TlpA disulfide reductase family protein [Olivibacter sp. SDN3]QNL47851.1 TlpA family protein disulfide reductase [Olivibacter sp. SDN3]
MANHVFSDRFLFVLTVCGVFFFTISYQQCLSQTVSGKILGKKVDSINFYFPAEQLGSSEQEISSVYPDTTGRFEFSKSVASGTFLQGFIFGKDRVLWDRQFYLSPTDSLSLLIKFAGDSNQVETQVSGRGSQHNQPLGFSLFYTDLEVFREDTAPDRVLGHLAADRAKKEQLFSDYIVKYQPQNAFVKDVKTQLVYSQTYHYYHFLENNKFQIRESFERNNGLWYQALDSLLTITPKQNDALLHIPAYKRMGWLFVGRTKEALWQQKRENPESFYRDWFDADTIKGKAILGHDLTNLICRQIIDHHFEAKTKEFLMARLITTSLEEGLLENLDKLYQAFNDEYPSSAYATHFRAGFEEKMKAYQRPLNEQMKLLDSTGTAFETIEGLLQQFAGKVVFLDMWGTWCGPCRSELQAHSEEIRNGFKDDEVVFLYVANHDINNTAVWRKLIPYYNLEGHHILAGRALTDDIMKKTGGRGFPTYIIVDKGGNYRLAETQYPMDANKLVAQLKQLLSSTDCVQ